MTKSDIERRIDEAFCKKDESELEALYSLVDVLAIEEEVRAEWLESVGSAMDQLASA